MNQFYDVRIQIKEKNLSGYYIEVENEKFPINPDGTLDVWPKSFDLRDLQLRLLIFEKHDDVYYQSTKKQYEELIDKTYRFRHKEILLNLSD